MREHWIYKDAEYLQVWLEMLFCARYSEESKTDMYKGTLYTIEYGQFIFGLNSWSERLSISYQRLRGLISKLLKTNMIKKVGATSKLTIYGITNYTKFNSHNNVLGNSQQTVGITKLAAHSNIDNNILDNSQVTVTQQSSNSQVTTKEECKKEKKEKKGKNENKNNICADIADTENIATIKADEIKEVWILYPGKKTKSTRDKKLPGLIKKYGKEQMVKTVTRYKDNVEEQRKNGFKTLQYQNEGTFWNSGYIDYLDSEYSNKLETKKKIATNEQYTDEGIPKGIF